LTEGEFLTGPFAFVVHSYLGVSLPTDLDSAVVIVVTGTEMELELNEFFRSNNMSYEPSPVSTFAEAKSQFVAGAGDVLMLPVSAVDTSALDSEFQLMPGTFGEIDLSLIVGTNRDDELTGSGANNVIKGRDGDDDLSGFKGDDTLIGGRGHDLLIGGKGSDHLVGGKQGDTLIGGKGLDVLTGGNGKDVLTGGRGNDKLKGGAGAESFDFSGTKSEGRDVIVDFQDGVDVLTIDGSKFAKTTVVGQGNGTLVTLDGGTDIFLKGVSVNKITADDFDFI
jgi:Ca2+-binding RTX toxin-like protein